MIGFFYPVKKHYTIEKYNLHLESSEISREKLRIPKLCTPTSFERFGVALFSGVASGRRNGRMGLYQEAKKSHASGHFWSANTVER